MNRYLRSFWNSPEIFEVVSRLGALGMGEADAKAALARLMEEGECYTPTTELIKVA